ncbi:elongation factor P 5-aminopentanone reductase [Caproicibacter fermentans]|uniref:SDR family oxidoreductase n=1 Tax=Caproicibacter fermentans TaxID=2576756 RepID=A0A7G8T7S3_9FIRM|nr:SDR family oxidoreductase [Caproicibacter fermentans]QNK39664.1 SDR family oxidoreductase [Caproicibacter fermentans]
MKKALVTGASGGIGQAVAARLAADGYKVYLNYFKNEKGARSLWERLTRACGPESAVLARADISDSAQAAELFRSAGKLDLLVNNAGIAQQKLFTDLTDGDWDQMFNVDVRGVFLCCRAALPDMIREKSGCILNISSMWGQVGASCEAHYSAAKAAVIGLTKALAKEVGPSGVRVNCIAPGVIATEMNAGFSEQTMEELREETPLCRIGSPEDIAAAVSFLASEQAGFITGQVLGVNGGMVI